VGAAIAKGNHAEKGIWALLVKAANKINNPTIFIEKSSFKRTI